VKPPPWHPPPGKRIHVVTLASNEIRTVKNQTTKINIQNSENKVTTMKKDRKKQEDRLLKHLSLRERQRQVQLRQMISQDPLFLVV